MQTIKIAQLKDGRLSICVKFNDENKEMNFTCIHEQYTFVNDNDVIDEHMYKYVNGDV